MTTSERRRRRDESFPFIDLDDRGQKVRHGFVIRVKERGRWEIWGDMVFPTIEGANSTAARCIKGECDIVSAKEVVHFGGAPLSMTYRRTILVEENSV
jgi:hypothetical protein